MIVAGVLDIPDAVLSNLGGKHDPRTPASGRVETQAHALQHTPLLQRADQLRGPPKANHQRDRYSRRCVRRHRKGTVQAHRRTGGATAQEGVLRAARESGRSRQQTQPVRRNVGSEVLS